MEPEPVATSPYPIKSRVPVCAVASAPGKMVGERGLANGTAGETYPERWIMLSGVSAVVRPEGVGEHSTVARTIADTLPLN